MEANRDSGLLSFRDYRPDQTSTPMTGQLDDPPADWWNSVMRQCLALAGLPPNWDTYGARPVNSITAAAAVRFLRRVVPSSLKIGPFVVPTATGGLQFEWSIGGRHLEVEYAAPTQVSILYSGEDGEWEKDLGADADLTPLAKALERIASPQ